MPYIRTDEGGEETPNGDVTFTGDFNYYSAKEFAYKPHSFDPATLTDVVSAIYAELIEHGVTTFRVTYDGGHDEGFAHADQVRFDGNSNVRSVVQLADDWAKNAELLKKLDNAARHRHAENLRKFKWMPAEYQPDTASSEQIINALDELAQSVAGALLGDGFGTGEYSMYGACVVDLRTNEISDDPDQSMPVDVKFD